MNDIMYIAGPCAVESENQILSIAYELKKIGVKYLRGGAFKPRTNPRSFQGLGEKGLKYLLKAKEKTGLKIVTEIMGPEEIKLVSEYADILQIGSRNMHNYDLLKKIAQRTPEKNILLKRGMQANKKEVLGAIQYLQNYGLNGEIYFCERGIRTFANGSYDRFTLDTGLIADLKTNPSFKHKIIVDPSHPAGRNDIVENLAYAGIAAGANGLIIEVKLDNYSVPKSDANQAIKINQLKKIIENSSRIAEVLRR